VTTKDKPTGLYSDAIAMKAVSASSSQNRREKGRPMAVHKYKVGQTLLFTPSTFEAVARKGTYHVVSLLPADGGDNQYRLKSDADGHERVVREGQLSL